MALLNVLKTNKNVRRIFGKRELEIISKQVKGFPLTQSERNRMSRDIKPKFEVMKEIARYEDEFKLEKGQENWKIIEKTVDLILKDKLHENIQAILLFGSFVNRSLTIRSDIDIGVVLKKDISLREATLFRIRIAGEANEKIDIQVFNTLPQKIKREIAKNHQVLYKKSEFDNIDFSIKYLKDDDYFIRMKKIFEVEV